MNSLKQLLVALVALTCSAGHAASIMNVSLDVGPDSKNPKPFIKCVIESGLRATFGDDVQFVSVSLVERLDDVPSASDAAIQFVAAKGGQDESYTMTLSSLDSDQKWRILRGSLGQVYLYSREVSSVGRLMGAGMADALAVDISICSGL
ncbi:MAG: hypothetical protein JNJ49_09115 [Bdellovibrionaceae bacterium]|nr:hypothetical protein [Pseudobdellovibrionaceae bacterium]